VCAGAVGEGEVEGSVRGRTAPARGAVEEAGAVVQGVAACESILLSSGLVVATAALDVAEDPGPFIGLGVAAGEHRPGKTGSCLRTGVSALRASGAGSFGAGGSEAMTWKEQRGGPVPEDALRIGT
jgi:hypothetical protein